MARRNAPILAGLCPFVTAGSALILPPARLTIAPWSRAGMVPARIERTVIMTRGTT